VLDQSEPKLSSPDNTKYKPRKQDLIEILFVNSEMNMPADDTQLTSTTDVKIYYFMQNMHKN
jgi:hypothetical protein